MPLQVHPASFGPGLRLSWGAVALASLLFAGCSVGPDYHSPTVASIPPGWGWKLAEPGDDTIKGDWWTLFDDATLNDLEKRATSANEGLKEAVARVDESRATARITRSDFFPQLSLDPSVTRFRTPPTVEPPLFTATTYTLPLDLSYEIDIWGRVRRSFEASRAEAQASVADYDTILLSLHGDVATNYFLLRQLDTQTAILQRTLDLRQKAVSILRERVGGGLTPQADLDQAITLAELTRTQLSEAQRQRADLQDALALLCGEAAPTFHLEPSTLQGTVPVVPLGLPSSLLERRPDIAAAERRMAAANARIGVAYAAFFPAISLTGQAGYSSFDSGTLLNWQSRLFQIGPQLVLPLVTGGRIEAEVKQARGEYDQTAAAYRQTVLVGFREVADALNDLHSYRDQSVSLDRAVAAARQTTGNSNQNYNQGLVNYLNVVDAVRVQLEAETQAAQIAALERVATVHLFKTLGGGFEFHAR